MPAAMMTEVDDIRRYRVAESHGGDTCGWKCVISVQLDVSILNHIKHGGDTWIDGINV